MKDDCCNRSNPGGSVSICFNDGVTLTEASMNPRARPRAGRDGLLENACADSHTESYPTTTTTTPKTKRCLQVEDANESPCRYYSPGVLTIS
jgi:hypothetical protein